MIENRKSESHAGAAAPRTALAAHTPGPWKVCGGQNGKCNCGIMWSIPGDFPICTVAGGSTFPTAVAHKHMADAPDMIYQTITDAERDANARLIAAAPDMLAALSDIDDAIKHHIKYDADRWPTFSEARDRVRSAISRATGAAS